LQSKQKEEQSNLTINGKNYGNALRRWSPLSVTMAEVYVVEERNIY